MNYLTDETHYFVSSTQPSACVVEVGSDADTATTVCGRSVMYDVNSKSNACGFQDQDHWLNKVTICDHSWRSFGKSRLFKHVGCPNISCPPQDCLPFGRSYDYRSGSRQRKWPIHVLNPRKSTETDASLEMGNRCLSQVGWLGLQCCWRESLWTCCRRLHLRWRFLMAHESIRLA